MNRLACLLRFLCGGLFVIAGALKALDPAHFAADIDHYHLLPYFAVAPLALYLPWLEMICGFATMAGAARRGALVLLLGLTVVFTLAVASAWLRGLDITCGCFGAASAVPLSFALVRNIVFGVVLLWLVRREGRPVPPL
ncbi:MAG TPA: MauE/DoxX family redox-associated membrane protein [Opitutaceae bacterium]|jgi:putative oxidoreductase|nr:MauE/DoxX family redox-associated membrane protein [Opitutaceae bacterium]